ncbi:MAG: hypothetical protein NXI00_20445 [Cytophagales bacterium]|nr:hypothetical protein [Cytophagales bacterium]
MITEIKFNKTGNFWVDNGIVGLYIILKRLNRNEISLELTSNQLVLKVRERLLNSEEEPLIDILSDANVRLTDYSLGLTGNYGWLYDEGKFEIYQKTDYKIFAKSFFKAIGIAKNGSISIPNNIELNYQSDDKKDASTEILVYNDNYGDVHYFKIIKTKIDKKEIQFGGIEKRKFLSGVFKPKKKNLPDILVENNKITNYETLKLKLPKRNAKEEVMSIDDFYSFLFFKEEHAEKKLSDKGFINTPPEYALGKDFQFDFLETKNGKICDFSGERLTKFTNITGMYYPFLVGKGKGDNFSSMTKQKPKISEKYAFISLYSPRMIYYSLQDDWKNYFLLYDSNLKELSNFNNKISKDLQELDNIWCNFKMSLRGTKYQNESLFNFILSMFEQTNQKLQSDDRKLLYTKSVVFLNSDGTFYRHVGEYTSVHQMFHFLNELQDFNAFKNLVSHFQKITEKKGQKKYDTVWRNKLCSNILSFQSIAKIFEQFLGEVELVKDPKKERYTNFYYLKETLLIYNQTFLNMTKDTIEMCHKYGVRIGNYCADSDKKRGSKDKGLLFAIRNAKNRKSLLNVLSESQFKSNIYFDKELFENLFLNESDWEEHKSLLSIFAMNQFIYITSKNEKSNEQSN